MEGWIKIHRQILDNPIICKDSDYLAVWIYLLLNATHKEIPALFKGEKIILQPGQLITGRKSMSDKLKISESKIYRVINEYIKEQQIEQQTSNKNSLITITKWNKYQQDEQQIEQQVKCNLGKMYNKTEQQIEQQKIFSNYFSSNDTRNIKQQNEQQNEQQLNNKRTTTEHKQECKEIYINLFNKYKSEIENANAREKILIIGRCKECEEYSKLTLEEQDQLFYDLMSIDKRYR